MMALERVDPLDTSDAMTLLRGAIAEAQTRRPETNWAQVWQLRQWMRNNWQPYEYEGISAALITSRLRRLEREGKVEQVPLVGKRGYMYNGWRVVG